MMPALLYSNESWIISAQIKRIVDITVSRLRDARNTVNGAWKFKNGNYKESDDNNRNWKA